MVLWNALEGSRRRENRRRGYLEVKTPLLYDLQTYITSGHYENYEENMFFVHTHEGEEPLALKPMNCPGHMLLFGSKLRSYRDLPIRYAESSTLHRDERGGTLHGLLRVKHITQDDAHVFVTEDQIQDEIDGMIDFMNYLYDRFGVTPRAELSTRPEKRLGTDEQWDRAERSLESALQRHEVPYEISPGEGTFYGPKIDLHMTDVLGRSWQMGTIQLDYQMPVQFGLTYMGPDNREHSPVVIHRALLGSLERFMGILIEHYGGEFPFWLSPVQARVIPVGESHRTRLARSATVSQPRATASRWTSATTRSASASATPRSRRCRSSSCTATASRTRPWRYAGAAASSRRSRSMPSWLGSQSWPQRPIPGRCYDPRPASRSSSLPHLPGLTRGGSTEPVGRSDEPLRAAVRVVYKEEAESLMKGL